MKKFVFLFMLSILPMSYTFGQGNGNPEEKKDTIRIPLVNSGGNKSDRPQSPIRIPIVSISGYTLFLYSGCDNTTIELYDEDETLVYTTYVPEGTEQITLPSSLAGVYELRIIRGSITFVAEIEL